jgi:hypothetical protein
VIDLSDLSRFGSPWVVRHTGSGTLANVDLVIPPAARLDPIPASGGDWRSNNKGELIVLGWSIRANAATAGDGFRFVDLQGASTEELRRFVAIANTTTLQETVSETYLPLRPSSFPVNTSSPAPSVTDPGRLRLEIIGKGPTQFSIVVWGVWSTEDWRNVGSAPLTI